MYIIFVSFLEPSLGVNKDWHPSHVSDPFWVSLTVMFMMFSWMHTYISIIYNIIHNIYRHICICICIYCIYTLMYLFVYIDPHAGPFQWLLLLQPDRAALPLVSPPKLDRSLALENNIPLDIFRLKQQCTMLAIVATNCVSTTDNSSHYTLCNRGSSYTVLIMLIIVATWKFHSGNQEIPRN